MQITVLEAAGRPGGTIWTEERQGYRFEYGPNAFLDTNPATRDLCRELGLGDQLVAANPDARHRYIVQGNRLKRLPASLPSVLSTDVLSWRDKIALLTERWRSNRRPAGDESVQEFARRRGGCAGASLLADILVTGIWAGDPERLSVRAALPRLSELEAEFGSVWKGFNEAARRRRHEARARGEAYSPPRMWSLRTGLRALIEALRERLEASVRLGAKARWLEPFGEPGQRPAGWRIRGEGTEEWQANAIVLACPAYEQVPLLERIDPALGQEIAGIVYNRLAVVALGFAAADVPVRLDGFGYLVPEHPDRQVLGVQWCSSLFPERAPSGCVLLRAMCGGWQHPEMTTWSDDNLVRRVCEELRATLGIEAAPRFHSTIRWAPAIPQYYLGHLERLARIDERLAHHPGLFLAGNAYRGVALNDCVTQGNNVATRVKEFVTLPHPSRMPQ